MWGLRETCQNGACTPGTPLNCNDNNVCTVDSCDPLFGCTHPAILNGTPCLDATVCNGAESCQNGTCTAGTPLNCNDNNPCTADSCDPVLGCLHTPLGEGASCSDGDICNGAETCHLGLCIPGIAPFQSGPTCRVPCDGTHLCASGTCETTAYKMGSGVGFCH